MCWPFSYNGYCASMFSGETLTACIGVFEIAGNLLDVLAILQFEIQYIHIYIPILPIIICGYRPMRPACTKMPQILPLRTCMHQSLIS